jgi:uncharacterized membrane protein YhaH (DUF805 family)
MKGQVLDFSIQSNSGIILGEDHSRYNFSGSEWRDAKAPIRGDHVDFVSDGAGNALQVYRGLQQSNPISSLTDQLDRISDQNKSEEQFTIVDWAVKGLKNYANFTGRARRKEFWFYTLAFFIVAIIVSIIDRILGTNPLLYIVLVLGLLVPNLAIAVRRLHDIGRSGWWYLIAFIPLIGAIILIIWFATDTQRENNQWGKPAK